MPDSKRTAEISGIDFKKATVANCRAAHRRFGKSIQVCRSRYKITLCQHLFYQGHECEGLFDSINKIIYLVVQDLDTMMATFMHEVCHASLHESTVTLTKHWDSTLEEIVVESLARDLQLNFDLRRRKK